VKKLWLIGLIALFAGAFGAKAAPGGDAAENAPKRIFYVSSYNKEYDWSYEIEKSLRKGLRNQQMDFRVFEMDSKRKDSEEEKEAAALAAKQIIDEWKPDVVIASDDAAASYLIKRYFKGSGIPFVFCGINWDATVYGFPFDNVTGMVEVAPTRPLIDKLKKYAKGERIGLISVDHPTEQKGLPYYEKVFKLNFDKIYMVETFNQWKENFLKLQNEVDMIYFVNQVGIHDWDEAAAKAFLMEQMRIPVGTNNRWVMPYSVLGYVKVPSEQGHWAAQAAIQILDGVPPSKIPITQNKKGVVFFNRTLARKVGITTEPTFATIVD